MPVFSSEIWDVLSNVVTVVGLPLAIFVFVYEQRKERENEDEEVYDQLSNAYIEFLKLIIAHPDLKLRSREHTPNLSEEQRERMLVIFDMLVSLFERAYLLVYEEKMSPKHQRRWNSWEDFMREWCRREDFRDALPELLVGEDPDFASHIRSLASKENTQV